MAKIKRYDLYEGDGETVGDGPSWKEATRCRESVRWVGTKS